MMYTWSEPVPLRRKAEKRYWMFFNNFHYYDHCLIGMVHLSFTIESMRYSHILFLILSVRGPNVSSFFLTYPSLLTNG